MEHKQHQPAKRETEEDETGQETAGVDETELTEDVSCCLAEIDEVLAEQEDEQTKAEREFREIKARYDRFYSAYLLSGTELEEQEAEDELAKAEQEAEDELRIWQAQYAHLGLSYHWCCGEIEIGHPR
jgi:hypothetical protein